MNMLEAIAGSVDVIIDWRCARRAMGIMGVTGIDRDGDGRRIEAVGKRHADMGVDVLNVLDDHRKADILGALDGVAKRQLAILDDLFAFAAIVVEIVIGPGRIGAVDYHLRSADRSADVEGLAQALPNDLADIRILRCDDETPEGAMDAE